MLYVMLLRETSESQCIDSFIVHSIRPKQLIYPHQWRMENTCRAKNIKLKSRRTFHGNKNTKSKLNARDIDIAAYDASIQFIIKCYWCARDILLNRKLSNHMREFLPFVFKSARLRRKRCFSPQSRFTKSHQRWIKPFIGLGSLSSYSVDRNWKLNHVTPYCSINHRYRNILFRVASAHPFLYILHS